MPLKAMEMKALPRTDMPTLLLRFPARRYHATPWGHHVNEGLIEWPPSPWRLLRALLATGYSAHGWDGNLENAMASSPRDPGRSLIRKLASVLPRYRLPVASGAHSRHFMPLAVIEKGREKTTLVFDTFAQVEDGAIAVTWDVTLDPAETALLAALAGSLNYLGRSESWVQARLAEPAVVLPDGDDCVPCAGMIHPGPGWEQVSLLALVGQNDFEAWRATAVEQALIPHPLPEKEKPKKQLLEQRAKAQLPFPVDLIACLQADTTWLRSHGWSQPPGTQRVLYWRKADAVAPGTLTQARTSSAPSVPFVLLSLMPPGHNNHVLPMCARTLPQAERLHRQLVGVYANQSSGRHSRVLTGCDEQHRPLTGAHGHAHVLPLDLDHDGHLDHVLMWAPDGFDSSVQQSLSGLRTTHAKGVSGALRLAVAAIGGVDDMKRLRAPLGTELLRTIGEGTSWISDTPFVPPRHLKKRGSNALHGQVCAELQSRGLPEPVAVEWISTQTNDLARQHRHTVRTRRNGPPPPVDIGFTLRLRFAQPVLGPICLGYGSHFGLGRFQLEQRGSN